MIFALSKIFIFLLRPIVWCFCIIVVGFFSKNSKHQKRLIAFAAIALFLFTNSFVVGKIFNFYEPGYPADEHFDVGVVLGGFSGISKRNNQIEFYAASDRLLQALSLYKDGKIGKLMIVSGNASLTDNSIKEADLVLAYLKKINIPDSAIWIDNQSRNTVENAKYAGLLIEKKMPNASIMVITSAWHIPRAKISFDKNLGKKVSYYPTQYIGKTTYYLGDYIIPSSAALSQWDILIKEWVGLLVDRFRN